MDYNTSLLEAIELIGEEALNKPPYSLHIKTDGPYTIFAYVLFESDLNYRCVREARGAIIKYIDGKPKFVCHPFDKFFNYTEPQADFIDWTTATVTEKIDGSMIQLWYDDGQWHMSTSGNIDAFRTFTNGISFGQLFTRALKIPLMNLYEQLDRGYTHLFELTTPENKVVMPYSDAVWYLTSFNNETHSETVFSPVGVFYPHRYDLNNLEDVVKCVQQFGEDQEGVVVCDAKSHRIKVKGATWISLSHSLQKGTLTVRNIVNAWKDGTLDDLISLFPNDKEKVDRILRQINELSIQCEADYAKYYDADKLKVLEKTKGLNTRTYVLKKYDAPDITPRQFFSKMVTDTLIKIGQLK